MVVVCSCYWIVCCDYVVEYVFDVDVEVVSLSFGCCFVIGEEGEWYDVGVVDDDVE